MKPLIFHQMANMARSNTTRITTTRNSCHRNSENKKNGSMLSQFRDDEYVMQN